MEVTFRAKPTVTIESSANGTVTVTGTVNGVEVTELPSGSYVDFGSDFTVTLKPDVGYEVGAMIGLDPAYTDTTGQTTDDKACTISNVQTDQTITPVWMSAPTSEISYSVVIRPEIIWGTMAP